MKSRNILSFAARRVRRGIPALLLRKWLITATVSLVAAMSVYLALAAISLSTSINYTQNFDTIGTSATAALPTDLKVDKQTTAVRTLGNYATAGTATERAGGANLSTSAANGIYNFGSGTTSGGGSDRAIGFLASGSGTASGNLYAQFVNNTGGSLSGLQISYDVEKYRNGSNAAGFSIQMYYSADGSSWTNAGSGFLTSFPQDANNNGFATAPGVTVSITNKTLNVAIPNSNNFYLAWNYSVTSGSTVTNAQALAVDNMSILGIASGPVQTNPTGVGAANPSTVAAGGSTLLTVAVTPGSNPASTGMVVTGDLTPIGGSATQRFFDDGTHGDVTPGDNTFSFQATVSSGTTPGSKSLPFTITDAQSRTSPPASISLTVPSPTPPTGVGAANPGTVAAGNSTLLTVAVTPGANPTSTGISVTGNLSSIGGSGSQQFFDDGTHGDVTPGDNTFSFQATVSSGTSAGAKSLPVSIGDAQSRTGNASISLTVTSPSTNPTGTGAASPNTVTPGGSTLLTVNVTPGANPTSTGIAVAGDLTAIGGSASQSFFDDGTHGDATPGDDVFSFQATVSNSTTIGAKSLPITVTDAQARSSSTTIALTIQPQTVPPGTLVISQVYGGGGNSGSTFKNDFIEIYNRGNATVNLAGWSVQYSSAAATTWQVTTVSGLIAPGHYFLVQESAGTAGTTSLPTPDATGTIAMSGTAAKVALVASAVALSGGGAPPSSCPTGAPIIDLVGYGATANCFETSPTPTLSATTAAIRKGNGCVDTDNNSADLFIGGPIPRNSASPVNSCGGDPSNPSGLGDSFPTGVDPASNVLLIVTVTPATTPPSTGIAVSGDLTSIGGAATQQFYDDGTHGDATAGDNVFSFLANVPLNTTFGAKSILTTITDAQSRSATAPITLTVQSPTCGVERWSVKTGTDPDAALVDLNNPVPTTIAFLSSFTAPADPPGPPLNARVAPAETTVYVVNATLTLYKKENDVDYHIVIQDLSGNTMVTEIPCPCCVGAGSPFAAGVANARATFDAHLTATAFFQSVTLPVQITGVGFFDFLHGQTGVAPNGIELHPILDIKFLASTSTTVASSANPSFGGQSVTFTAAVTSTGNIAPTGFVTFKDGANVLGTGFLNAFGMATFTTSSLSIGSHSITAEYSGDANSGGSLGALTQTVLNNPPVARCKNITVSADSSCAAGGSSTSVDDGSYDPDSDPITITQTPAGPYSLGSTTVTLTVDDHINIPASSCTAVVTVTDTTLPVVTCPAGTTASAGANCQAAVPNVTGGVTASDNCTPPGSLTITQNPAAGALVGLGVTTITVTVKDAANNAATCATTFTVQDTTPPSISAPADANYQCASAVPAASAAQATASDNCGTPTVTVTESNNGGAGSPASPLIITRVYTATDGAGQNASAAQTITVIDNTPPVITTCATNKTLSANANCQASIPNLTGEVVAADNCSPVTVLQSPAAGTLVGVGNTTVTITVKDAANNQSTCVATVTVVDTTPPTVACPAGTTASADANCQAAVPDVVGSVTVSDDCTPAGSLTITQDPAAGTRVGLGVTTITVTAKDAANNAATCTTTFTVNDSTPPTISCPNNITRNNDAGQCSAVVTFQPTASDNCTGVTTICTPASGSAFAVGTTTVTCTATDAAGNHAGCSFTVAVNDAQPPTIACPANITHGTDANASTAVVSFQPSVNDNCPGVTFTCNPASGSPFNVGTTTVTCTATDASSNTASCSFTVTVVDTQPPSITCAPDQSKTNDPNQCGAVFTYPNPTVTDNTPGATFVCSPASGGFFPIGTTMVTCAATDSGGNHSNCSFAVTVNDTQPPVITCPANVTVAGNIFGACSANVTIDTPTASDNCPGVIVTGVRSDGLMLTAPYPQGATTITWTARDASNNTASCQQTVTITNPAPVVMITGPAGGALFEVNTPVSFTGTFTDNLGGMHTATWMFDTITSVATVVEPTASNPGTANTTFTFTSTGVYLVKLTVNDGCGAVTTADTVGGLTAMVVIYDPNGGFVTGGGWINSPAGAYTPNPSLTGKASFGFVSKYEHGANVPAGNTEFQFHGANFDFHSTVYEWLVIAGARAQYKGSGTVNGAGDYGFILTAIDGDINGGGGVDKFRIKIWNKNGGGIVYDNQINDPDSSDPTTVLGGGGIVIHK